MWWRFAFLRTSTRRCKCIEHTRSYCNLLQHTAAHCNTLQQRRCKYTIGVHCNTRTHCNLLPHTATQALQVYAGRRPPRNSCARQVRHTLHYTATRCKIPQDIVTHCNTLQHIVIHYFMNHSRVRFGKYCNTPQHAATHCLESCARVGFDTLQRAAARCNTLQCVTACCIHCKLLSQKPCVFRVGHIRQDRRMYVKRD